MFLVQDKIIEISASHINPFALRALPLGGEEIPGSKSNSVKCEIFLPSQGRCCEAAEGSDNKSKILPGEMLRSSRGV